ncbi:MAG: N-acetylmuramoyl-L-alanine amidase, partial [Candidatus Omnitrophota bacterium]
DKFISLDERARIANSQNVDFFISVHANASRSKWVSGVEVFYISEQIDDNTRSKKTAKNYDPDVDSKVTGAKTEAIVWDLIHSDNRASSREMAEYVCSSLSQSLTQKNRGTKQARFYVLNGTNTPAILIEVGFISNPTEEKKLTESSYCGKIAQAVTDGILQYNRTNSQEYYSRN